MTTEVDISTAAAPTSGQILTAIDESSAEWKTLDSASINDIITLLNDDC